jgi:hypothetical protein
MVMSGVFKQIIRSEMQLFLQILYTSVTYLYTSLERVAVLIIVFKTVAQVLLSK